MEHSTKKKGKNRTKISELPPGVLGVSEARTTMQTAPLITPSNYKKRSAQLRREGEEEENNWMTVNFSEGGKSQWTGRVTRSKGFHEEKQEVLETRVTSTTGTRIRLQCTSGRADRNWTSERIKMDQKKKLKWTPVSAYRRIKCMAIFHVSMLIIDDYKALHKFSRFLFLSTGFLNVQENSCWQSRVTFSLTLTSAQDIKARCDRYWNNGYIWSNFEGNHWKWGVSWDRAEKMLWNGLTWVNEEHEEKSHNCSKPRFIISSWRHLSSQRWSVESAARKKKIANMRTSRTKKSMQKEVKFIRWLYNGKCAYRDLRIPTRSKKTSISKKKQASILSGGIPEWMIIYFLQELQLHWCGLLFERKQGQI